MTERAAAMLRVPRVATISLNVIPRDAALLLGDIEPQPTAPDVRVRADRERLAPPRR